MSDDYEFDRHDIRVEQRDYLPVEVADVRHPSRGGWRNEAIEAYHELWGEAEYEANSREQFLYPMPARSKRGERGLRRLRRTARMMFGTRALFTGKRVTHFRGVGARGHIDIVAQPEFPEHEFFRAGRRFDCRLRHANASFADDALVQVRGCALKFTDADFDSPYDLVLNSGATSAFWSFWSFMDFAKARTWDQFTPSQWTGQKRWFRRLPYGFIGSVESLRSLPSSFADVTYYAKIAYPFQAKDGRRRYAKYRVLRPGLERESGLLTPAEQRKAWYQSRERGDERPKAILAREFEQRLASPLEYQLQIQLWDWDDERDTAEVLNLCRYWDEGAHPWLDLATVTLDAAMPAKQTEVTRFWLGHQPASLGIAEPTHIRDYRSLAWARVGVYGYSRKASVPLGKLLGRR